jgi:hypothetical protein
MFNTLCTTRPNHGILGGLFILSLSWIYNFRTILLLSILKYEEYKSCQYSIVYNHFQCVILKNELDFFSANEDVASTIAVQKY